MHLGRAHQIDVHLYGLFDGRRSDADMVEAANTHQSFSTTMAMPCPPPMHIVARPYLPPLRSSSYSSFTIKMAPVAPIGWPSEIPLPLGLTLRSEEHTSALQSLMRISYDVFCL